MGIEIVEHLPPLGWADVARKSDVDHLRSQIADLKSATRSLAAGLWALGTMMSAGFIGLFTLIATKLSRNRDNSPTLLR